MQQGYCKSKHTTKKEDSKVLQFFTMIPLIYCSKQFFPGDGFGISWAKRVIQTAIPQYKTRI
jgi:hypothetical protein